ncbi:UDP-galactopyranose mutase [Niabella sp. CC-SYL272]|uniref:UDP-galactopyranose mutase n=1 Tax=Niabella agricola TaxID=2891571 RepID=UPI001F1A02D6|nr:UDP-galactopyranose mutase [Niabella agricola]MCF3110628.1 UDP-galactopyranose mutase [Niabella agricola]
MNNKVKPYDYLIVGAGLFGATFAHEMYKRDKKCLVIDKRNHIGGNIYCQNWDGINVHMYGAHIFHTNDEAIWKYVNAFTSFNRYTNSPLAMYNGRLYNLPFNMNTFQQLWGVTTPEAARAKIEQQVNAINIKRPRNLEEQALSLVGYDIYYSFIKEYTKKQWGKDARELPPEIIKRIPVRFTYDNNYFNDLYQGIPIGGYNRLSEGLLAEKEVRLNINYISNQIMLDDMAEKVVYTGMLDELFDYKLGKLEYRSLHFDHERLEVANYQGNAVVNYTEAHVPYTRIIEHKHFEFGNQNHTIITREYPVTFSNSKETEPYYPINDDKNNRLYKKYKELANGRTNLIIGGRLGDYRYYDMHQVIASALTVVKKEEMKW